MKIRIRLSIFLFSVLPHLIIKAETESFLSCLEIHENSSRLECFDKSAKKFLEDIETLGAETNRATPTSAPLEQDKPIANTAKSLESFGVPAEKTEPVVQINAEVTNIRRTATGRQLILLSNGQTWMENEPGKRTISRGENITIVKDGKHYDLRRVSKPRISVHRIE